MGISLFAEPSFLFNKYPNLAKGDTIWRLSSDIRAKQIAERIGGKYNPEDGYENDVCIHVKPKSLSKVQDGDYVDISDGGYLGLVKKLKVRPKVKVIAHTQYLYKYLRDKLPNEMVYIPQQHLNWERSLRTRKEITTGGYIGRTSPICTEINTEIKQALEGIGMEFIICHNWITREDAINFYQSIDFLVIGGYGKLNADDPYITPTKMINAASFGIPSFSYPRVAYEEFEGYYTQFKTMDELVSGVKSLNIDKNRLQAKAEEYHIDRIVQKYLALC